jgi:hypothetical protein
VVVSLSTLDSLKPAGSMKPRCSGYSRHTQIATALVFIEHPSVDLRPRQMEAATPQPERVAACEVLIALIDRNWLKGVDDKGLPRISDPKDFGRPEIHPLARGTRVIQCPWGYYVARRRAAQRPRGLGHGEMWIRIR